MKRINRYFALLFILFLAVALPAVVSADTPVSGIIDSDTTWTLSDSPYIVTGSVLVNSGVTLTIEPGVIVRFDSGAGLQVGLQVEGTLIAIGTDTDNITFTSNQSEPAAGDWAYIFFTDSSTDATYDADGNYTGGSILEYCVIEYADSSTLRMDNAHPFINYCTIGNNSASGINAYNLTGTIKITNSTISSKIYVSGADIVTILSNTIGGIYLNEIVAATISNNTISSGGSGIDMLSSGGIVTISNNTISNNTEGVSVHGDTITISNNTISDNSSSGVTAYGNSVIINNNTVDYSKGRGIYVSGGTIAISNNTISNNTVYAHGGGIYASGDGIIYNNTISSNSAKYYSVNLGVGGGSGGGIYVSGGTITISNNTIDNNTANSSGGGVHVSGGTITISSNTISNNTAFYTANSNAYGGGIRASNSTITISDNLINNNFTSKSGGGVSVYNSTITISNNTIDNNTANFSGGGIYVKESTVTVLNNTIGNNTASYGGGIHTSGTTTITSNSIVGNSAENASAVYYSSVADQDFKNNTITENIATGAAPTYTVFVGGNPLFNYNDIFNNTATYELWNNNGAGSDNLDATNNWWGTTDESEIQAKIYDWSDNISKGFVNYFPFLDSPFTPTPNIFVSPASYDFGDIYIGDEPFSGTFTICNIGTADLEINDVYLTGTNSIQFSIQNDNCTGVTIAISGSCTVDVVFSPTETGELSADLSIDSNDPDIPTLYIELRGYGELLGANNPPSAPELLYPEDGQTGLGTTVEFRWEESTDPDGDSVTYDLYVCEDEGLTTGCITEEGIASLENKGSYYAGIGGAGILLFGIVLTGRVRGRMGIGRSGETGKRRWGEKRKINLLIAMVIITGMLLVSCGVTPPGDGDDGETGTGDEVSYTISDINPNTIYYWKVVADDDNDGGTTESETRSFSSR